MSKKSRYLLLGAGFVLFMILAPLLVLYVSGVNYDLKTHHFFRTGILSFQIDPKDASVYLNGKLAKKSSGDISFLKPGEYEVTISKNGYHDWSKRLVIQANQVTWASPVPNKLVLFLKDNPIANLSDKVTDFYVSGDTVIYATPTAVGVTVTGKNQNDVIPVPFSQNPYPQNPAALIPSADGTFAAIMAQDGSLSGVFDLKAKKITDISGLFTQPVRVQFSDNNELYALENGSLYKVGWKFKEKTLQAHEVQAFYLQNNSLYLLRHSATTSVVTLADSSSLEEQVLSANLPAFEKAEITVNYQKQLFILGDGTLYKVNNNLQKLTNAVSSWWFNSGDSSLIVSDSGELNFYNLYDEKMNFITRSSAELKNPLLAPSISYAFAFRGNDIVALELDTRDRQNEQVFYTATSPQKFMLDPGLKYIYVLDGGNLKSIKIR